MDSLAENDLKTILEEFSDFEKSYMICTKDRKEQLDTIVLLKESLKVAQDSENNMRLKLKENQANIIQLQEVVDGLIKTRDENDELKKEINRLQELLEQERTKYKDDEQKWNEERENIVKTNREEIENMKKIRNMEVSSLNREINRIQGEHHQQIEFLKREFERAEDESKRTVSMYEEKLTRLSRDLISAQSELNNLRLLNDNSKSINPFINVGNRPTKERYIPQPLSFLRFKPLKPIVTTASQMYMDEEEKLPEGNVNQNDADSPSTPHSKKKKKLYNRSDDLI